MGDGGGGASARAQAVESSVKVWTGQLVDLSARNNLLFFRDLKVGTLDLAAAPEALLFGVLAGKTATLASLFSDEEGRADAVKRARGIHNRGPGALRGAGH
jgi:hypothetical protein